MTVRSLIFLLIRIFLCALFIYSGFVKAWNPGIFFHDVLSYRILSAFPSTGVVWYLPYLEIVCGIALLIHGFIRVAAKVLSGLIILFMAAITSAWVRGLDISCGCFGAQEQEPMDYRLMLLRNITLLILVVWIGYFNNKLPPLNRSQ